MNKYVILYFKEKTDQFVSQMIIESDCMLSAIEIFESTTGINPIVCYDQNLPLIYISNPIPYNLQKDIILD